MSWSTAAAALALALSAMVVSPGSASAESNGGTRIMPLGDSITDGLDVPSGYRIGLWRRLVLTGYQADFVGSQFNGPGRLPDHDYEGHPGWRIDEVDAKVVRWLEASKPQSVLLHIGTNDVLNADAAAAPERLSTLIDHITATAPTAEVFVATIIPLGWARGNAAVRAYNSAIPGIVKSKVRSGQRVHLVDMYSALTRSDLSPGGVHPTAGGYDKMAAVWYRALASVPAATGARHDPAWLKQAKALRR